MNKSIVLVKVKTVYGVEKIYPANSDAILLAELAGTKTLTRESLETIKKLGYTVEQVHDTVKL